MAAYFTGLPVISAEYDGKSLLDLGFKYDRFSFESGRKPVTYTDERRPGESGGTVGVVWERVVYRSERQSVREEFSYTTEAERDAIDDELRRRGVPI